MQIYWVHPKTGEFQGAGTANEDPRVPGRFAVPADATDVAPPEVGTGQVALFKNGVWRVEPDHRGEIWWDSEGQPVVIEAIGDPVANGLASSAPPLQAEALIGYTMQRRDELIDGGVNFRSVVYQTRPTDRENIIGAALMASLAVAAGAQPGDYRWADPAADFEWIAMDNSKVQMDALTVIELGKAQAARKQELIFKARWIKDQIAAGAIITTAEIDAAFA